MIEIAQNFSLFKKGIFDTFKMFKMMYQNDHNILFLKNNTLYINNVEQLVNERSKATDAYSFGVDFALQNLKNFRENICINPILYIVALETLLNSITDIRDLEKYSFKKLSDSLKWYYEESSLKRAIITMPCIKKLFIKESEDKFLNEVIERVYTPSNVEIVESKHNRIVKHKYYKLKARFINGSIYGEKQKLFVVDILTKELFAKLVNLAMPILVLCSETDFEVTNTYLLSIYVVSKTEIIKHYTDICLLTGFGRGFQNLDTNELNSYSFGDIKEFKFDGTLMFSSEVYYNASELERMGIKDKYSYYALQGKNLTIETTEEYLEKVRCIVSIIKSLQNNGIFYGECKTLRILRTSYNVVDKILSDFIETLLRNYLNLFKFNIQTINEVVNNPVLKSNFNAINGKYDDEYFTSLDYYLNIFNLLDSNVKVLSKLA